ncbi:MAG: amidohydrolase family protein [Pseudomonadota bacterium]
MDSERHRVLAQMGYRDDWIAQVQEDVIDPEREIVDPHHHLWHRGGSVYELDRWMAETTTGHRVVQSVFIECRAYYREDGPDHLKPVGETETVARLAGESATRPEGATIAAIVAHADLRLEDLDEVLDAHEAAGQGLFRGIRHAGSHPIDPDPLIIPGRAPEGLYADPSFRRGVQRLGARGLTYDTWHYHYQNRDFVDLARACPGTMMVLDHFGTPLGVGVFSGKRDEIFESWKEDMNTLANCPNVVAKLGGMAMPDNGFGWHLRDRPPTSDEFVEAQADWYHHVIDVFGPDRCMFESNFPVDKVSIGYRMLWNGLKKIAARYSDAEQDAMFSGTARRVYQIPEPA